MSEAYKIKKTNDLYFVTFTVVYWVDIFTRQVYRDILIDNLKYCRKNKDLDIFAYVIMSNHVHLLLRSRTNKLSETIRDLKSYTSKQIIKEITDNHQESRKKWLLNLFKFAGKYNPKNKKYQFWTNNNHAELIYSNKFIDQKINYIHDNPVKAGIVEKPEDYLYSSARNYADLENLFEIDLIG